MPINLDILQGWTSRAQRVKALQDQANAEVSALADELARRGARNVARASNVSVREQAKDRHGHVKFIIHASTR